MGNSESSNSISSEISPDSAASIPEIWNIPHFYCINLTRSVARRSRMISRFQRLLPAVWPDVSDVGLGLAKGSSVDMEDNHTFIQAVTDSHPLVKFYAGERMTWSGMAPSQFRRDLAVYASHLKAVRTFLDSSRDYAFICEDDIMFHRDFIRRFRLAMGNIPREFPLVSLSYMITTWEGSVRAGLNPDQGSVYKLNSETVWGAQLYLISRKYAEEVWERWHKPVGEEIISSEVILRQSQGFLIYHPLALEEGLDSERKPEDMPYHHRHFSAWPVRDYMEGETIKSPLEEATPWESYNAR